MAGLNGSPRFRLIALGVFVVAAFALLNPVGAMILQRPTDGGPCDAPASAEGLDFRSAFNSENQLVNGSMIRSLGPDPSPDCTRIGGSFRCTQAGPTTVEVRLASGPLQHFVVPDGAQATFFGDRSEAFCVITSGEAAG